MVVISYYYIHIYGIRHSNFNVKWNLVKKIKHMVFRTTKSNDRIKLQLLLKIQKKYYNNDENIKKVLDTYFMF